MGMGRIQKSEDRSQKGEKQFEQKGAKGTKVREACFADATGRRDVEDLGI